MRTLLRFPKYKNKTKKLPRYIKKLLDKINNQLNNII